MEFCISHYYATDRTERNKDGDSSSSVREGRTRNDKLRLSRVVRTGTRRGRAIEKVEKEREERTNSSLERRQARSSNRHLQIAS